MFANLRWMVPYRVVDASAAHPAATDGSESA
jgi:hypothetical protein